MIDLETLKFSLERAGFSWKRQLSASPERNCLYRDPDDHGDRHDRADHHCPTGHVDQFGGRQRATIRERLMFGGAALAFCGMLAFGMASETPLVLYPITASLPSELFIRSFEPLSASTIVAFPATEAAKRYKALTGQNLHEEFLSMKAINFGPGNHVCDRPDDANYVNGIRNARASMHDRAGGSPLRWRGRQHMAEGEHFALSTYVQNNFGSRQFGAIRSSKILGTYLLLMEFLRRTRKSTSQHCRWASRRWSWKRISR